MTEKEAKFMRDALLSHNSAIHDILTRIETLEARRPSARWAGAWAAVRARVRTALGRRC